MKGIDFYLVLIQMTKQKKILAQTRTTRTTFKVNNNQEVAYQQTAAATTTTTLGALISHLVAHLVETLVDHLVQVTQEKQMGTRMQGATRTMQSLLIQETKIVIRMILRRRIKTMIKRLTIVMNGRSSQVFYLACWRICQKVETRTPRWIVTTEKSTVVILEGTLETKGKTKVAMGLLQETRVVVMAVRVVVKATKEVTKETRSHGQEISRLVKVVGIVMQGRMLPRHRATVIQEVKRLTKVHDNLQHKKWLKCE